MYTQYHSNRFYKVKKVIFTSFYKGKILKPLTITITSKIEEKSKIDSISLNTTQNKLIDRDTYTSTQGENILNFETPPTTFSTSHNKDNNFHMILRPK